VKLSVIIPVLNERSFLPAALEALGAANSIHEIIVVDGGSIDGTRAWLAAQSGLQVLDTTSQRGKQLNVGARAASGDVLLFLHADCIVPPPAGVLIQDAISAGAAGGCFCVRFIEKRPATLLLTAWGINLRSRLARTATGDQAIFVRKDTFQQCGGFPEWPLFEDVELVRCIKRIGRFVVIPSFVRLSARRYLAQGVIRTALLIFVLRLGFWVGVSPYTLKKWFADIRPHFGGQNSAPANR
jgi:rSAM/selenodomain-associated transferase 2